MIPREIIELDLDQLDWGNAEEIKSLFLKLLNLIAELAESNANLQEENQRLKGEGASTSSTNNDPKSSDNKERRKRREKSKNWKKSSKKGKVKIDRTEICKVDRSILPPDVKFLGYRDVVKQNIKIVTDNVEYKLEQFYSESKDKFYEANLPPDAPKGEFGADLEALAISLNHIGRMPHDKIYEFLNDVGALISKGKVTNILNKTKQEEFTREREDIYEAGMGVSDVVHTDSTGIKHKGEPYNIHVLCNELFSYFSIEKHKNRDTVRKLLRIPEGVLRYIIMVADDAKQYRNLCIFLSLCWLHEIRHYEKLKPLLQIQQKAVDEKIDHVWDYYLDLKEYKEWACKKPPPPPEEILKRQQELEKQFDEIFTPSTDYDILDHRLDLTAAKKERLLVPLYHPHVPLNNNNAERPLREPVIRRKISGGTRSEDGKQTWENMFTIKDTCRKQDVSFYHYLCDIISGRREMTPLSTLIRLKVNRLPVTY